MYALKGKFSVAHGYAHFLSTMSGDCSVVIVLRWKVLVGSLRQSKCECSILLVHHLEENIEL